MRSNLPINTAVLLASSLLVGPVSAHGGHDQVPLAADADWETRHMYEEHHIGAFDAGVFFSLHDFDSSGQWTAAEIRRTYGLEHESTNDVPEDKKISVAKTVIDIFDTNKDGVITLDEFTSAHAKGITLPDFGLGPGHHGDDEYEYEIHHFEKFHGDDAKEEDLIHPEDIAHFKKHEAEEAAREAWEKREREGIVEANIPSKFRRGA